MGDMDWGDVERGGHLKKFFIKMLVFLLVISIIVVAVIFFASKKRILQNRSCWRNLLYPAFNGRS